MLTGCRRRRFHSGGAVVLGLLAILLGASTAGAAGPPILTATWSSSVFTSSARLNARVDPNGLTSFTYHFEYLTKAAYDANGGTFTGATRVPAASDATASGLSGPTSVSQAISPLASDTAYRYRVMISPAPASPDTGKTLITQPLTASPVCANKGVRDQQHATILADCRGWEMVSPVEKNGGQVDPPGTLAGGGVDQASAGGGLTTFSSANSFAGGDGAPPASQYIAGHTSGGWSTQNISPPIFSGSYDTVDQGAPFQLFSPDFARALLLNGDHCRGGASGCAVPNPPLAGTGAPEGYQDYYLRASSTGAYEALLGAPNAGFLDISPADFDLRFAGASPDLSHVVVSTCAKLTADATEAPLASGCDPTKQNLYEYTSGGGGLSLVNATPGAALAAQSGAVSANGARVYFTDTTTGNLYLRDGTVKSVDADAGGGGSFQTASSDGSVAFFTKGGHLWRYLTSSAHATDLTPSGGVTGVLGADSTGNYLYFLDSGGLELWHSGATTNVASGADASNYPPTTGTARVSSDGTKLLFVSTVALSTSDGNTYDNTDQSTGSPDSQVYLYDAAGPALRCVSCNPTLERPVGASSIPGAIANGTAPGSTDSYKPRVLSADGRRVFFDSADALLVADSNGHPDVYEWEANGEGSCTRTAGCVSLVSSGRSPDYSSFIDASTDGSDAFFLTDGSLVDSDPGAQDLYDARIGGGFAIPSPVPACEGDDCQVIPAAPEDPVLDTTIQGLGNPPVRYHRLGPHKKKAKRCRKGTVKRKGHCVKKKRPKHKRHHKRGGRR